MPSSAEPFLGYLTVFKSRLGLGTLVLDATTFGHQPERALRRRVRQVLEQRVAVDLRDPSYAGIFSYLLDKKLVGSSPRTSGRYRGVALVLDGDGAWTAESVDSGTLRALQVFQTDIWLAHPDVRSTIGVPTPDNVEEVIEFSFQLRLLDQTKNSWTSTGHLVHGLRQLTAQELRDPANPFLLGAEAIALLRCLLEQDGLLLRELLRFLGTRKTIRRDEVAAILPALAQDALDAALEHGINLRTAAAGRRLVARYAGAGDGEGSSGPGVREHRSSPRLEWLTDLGYLSKEGLPKNGFEYRVTESLAPFAAVLDAGIEGGGDWASSVAVSAWRTTELWKQLRKTSARKDERTALRTAYEVLRRPIGPAPLRDVAFIASLLFGGGGMQEVTDRIMAITQETPGASLSGGRMTRAPENIYMTDESLAALTSK